MAALTTGAAIPVVLSSPDVGCGTLAPLPAGAVVIMRRGGGSGCTFVAKLENAQAAGAGGVILVNNQ
jgi:hypothetical protein